MFKAWNIICDLGLMSKKYNKWELKTLHQHYKEFMSAHAFGGWFGCFLFMASAPHPRMWHSMRRTSSVLLALLLRVILLHFQLMA